MRELVDDVLEHTIVAADREALQRGEAEADMANVLQWIARMPVTVRHGHNTFDAVTLPV